MLFGTVGLIGPILNLIEFPVTEGCFSDETKLAGLLAGHGRVTAIPDDREQPCPCRPTPKLRKGLERSLERILDDIFAQRGIVRQMPCQIIGSVEMRQDHGAKCRNILSRAGLRGICDSPLPADTIVESDQPHLTNEFARVA